jgi:O-antigen/teichoic acid export membrane protein
VTAAAPAVAWFYGEPALGPVTIVLSLAFPIGSLAVQHMALLRREMRFVSLAVGDLASGVPGLVVTVVLAWQGAQYWARVLGRLAEALGLAVIVWACSGWRPGRPVRGAGVRPMLLFGGNLTGFSVANYFARNFDNLLIRKYWAPEQLGLYTRAYQLLLLPIQLVSAPIAEVAVPALCRLIDQPQRYRHAYLRILESIGVLMRG